jgi:hypothetical protein
MRHESTYWKQSDVAKAHRHISKAFAPVGWAGQCEREPERPRNHLGVALRLFQSRTRLGGARRARIVGPGVRARISQAGWKARW